MPLSRENALTLLRGGSESIREWNRLRSEGAPVPDLEDADLSGVELRGADLSRMDLSCVGGLIATQLAGCDLTGAKLPEGFAFDALEVVSAASESGRTLFFTMSLACAYAALTVATTADHHLLTNSATSALPIIGTVIPIVNFYLFTPLVLLALYVYFHLHLYQLWRGLASLPAILPDGRSLDQAVHPWLVNGLILDYVERLKQRAAPLRQVRFWTAFVLLWGLPPLSLLFLWARFLGRRDTPVTLYHVAVLAVAVGVGLIFVSLAEATFRGSRWPSREDFVTTAGSALLCFAALWIMSHSVINGRPATFDPNRHGAYPPPQPGWLISQVHAWAQWMFDEFRYDPFPDVEEAEVSEKLPGWDPEADSNLPGTVRGARLRRRDLRYLRAREAFLASADLREADLRWADLSIADLRGSDLREADLRGVVLAADLRQARMEGANLQGADLRGANFLPEELRLADNWPLALFDNDQAETLGLSADHANRISARNLAPHGAADAVRVQGASFEEAELAGFVLDGIDLSLTNFTGANLADAQLVGANLTGATLVGANLIGANLRGADLTGADLTGAELTGADIAFARLHEVRGLEAARIQQAIEWETALYDETLLAGLGLTAEQPAEVLRRAETTPDISPASLRERVVTVAFWALRMARTAEQAEFVAQGIQALNADLIVLAEVMNSEFFDHLRAQLPSYPNAFTGSGQMRITLLGKDTVQFKAAQLSDSPVSFARPPVTASVSFGGLTFGLIAIHLRAQFAGRPDSAVRRQSEATVVSEWVQEEYPAWSGRILLLGTTNVSPKQEPETYRILESGGRLEFLSTGLDYTFIGPEGRAQNQLLEGLAVSEELRPHYVAGSVVAVPIYTRLKMTMDAYRNAVSDHLPLVVRFREK